MNKQVPDNPASGLQKNPRIQELFEQYDNQQNPLGCFDALYRESFGDTSQIPWAQLKANPLLQEWQNTGGNVPSLQHNRALVIGCGLGDDAEFLASIGWEVTAFDLSSHAISWCRARFPVTPVNYLQADLFKLPANFQQAFDFVFESNTIQAIPVALRRKAILAVAGTVALNGKLLVLARGRDEGSPLAAMPWPLSRAELQIFSEGNLAEVSFAEREIIRANEPVRIFQVEYAKA